MSLRGRYVIDRIKRAVSHHFSLPVPPYGDCSYWESVYKTLGSEDAHEWGFKFEEQLLQHNFTLLRQIPDSGKPASGDEVFHTTFGEAIGVHPEDENKKIMMLGCGNSKFGEDLIKKGWNGPMVQVDVAANVLESMAQRCTPTLENESGIMEFVQDDATQLSAFDDNTMDAVIDKGLIDALFCADCSEQIRNITKSVQRVLTPNGVFSMFSFSAPQFLMPELILSDKSNNHNRSNAPTWRNIQVRNVDSTIYMYRFQKGNMQRPQARFQGKRGSRKKK